MASTVSILKAAGVEEGVVESVESSLAHTARDPAKAGEFDAFVALVYSRAADKVGAAARLLLESPLLRGVARSKAE